MKKSMLFAAAAVVAMVGCTNEDFTGVQEAPNGSKAINFGSVGKTITRAEKTGAEAAEALKNNFVVYGFKSTDALNETKFTSNVSPVFDHYSVNYGTGTAYSTESNTENWEYVGQDMSGLQSETVKAQTIKYWDFAATQYNFVAFSKGANTETNDTYSALFSKVDNAKLGTSDAAYTITGTVAQLQKCYVADLLTVKQADFGTGAVTPKFRKMGSKIRFGIYETVPGYSVKNVQFYTEEKSGADLGAQSNKPTLFTKGGAGFPKSTAKGTMAVSFPTVGSSSTPATDINKAHIKFTKSEGDLESTLTFANNLTYTAAAEQYEAEGDYIGRSSTTASYPGATPEAAYLDVLPTDAGQNIELQVNYTLVSTDGSGEEIKVMGATAIVPSIYTEWQPNYAYTYLFKISDKTNGVTNPDVADKAGLYPITFDAIVMGDEDGIQETITEIGSTPITTYQNGKIVTANDEYVAGDTIYVVVDDATKEFNTTANTVGCVALYTAEATTASIQTITEASVGNCFINGEYASNAYTVKDIKAGTLKLTAATNLELVAEIPATNAPHGVAIPTVGSTSGSKTAAAINKPESNKYYVFQYQNKAAVWGSATDKTLSKGTTYYTMKDFGSEGILVSSFESTGKEIIEETTYMTANPFELYAENATIATTDKYYVLVGGKYVEKTPTATITVSATDKYYKKNTPTYVTDSDATLKTGTVYYTDENLQSRKVALGTESTSGTYVITTAPEFTYKVIKVQ